MGRDCKNTLVLQYNICIGKELILSYVIHILSVNVKNRH
jgi:hypothetical protein